MNDNQPPPDNQLPPIDTYADTKETNGKKPFVKNDYVESQRLRLAWDRELQPIIVRQVCVKAAVEFMGYGVASERMNCVWSLDKTIEIAKQFESYIMPDKQDLGAKQQPEQPDKDDVPDYNSPDSYFIFIERMINTGEYLDEKVKEYKEYLERVMNEEDKEKKLKALRKMYDHLNEMADKLPF